MTILVYPNFHVSDNNLKKVLTHLSTFSAFYTVTDKGDTTLEDVNIIKVFLHELTFLFFSHGKTSSRLTAFSPPFCEDDRSFPLVIEIEDSRWTDNVRCFSLVNSGARSSIETIRRFSLVNCISEARSSLSVTRLPERRLPNDARKVWLLERRGREMEEKEEEEERRAE